MELWIRSQSKRNLMKAEDIVAADNRIEIFKQNEYSTTVGEYKTKERALEVLDEIHEHIEKQGSSEIIANESGIATGVKYYGKVYEMPKE